MFKMQGLGVPAVAQQVKNPTSIHKDTGSIPGLPQCIRSQTQLRYSIAMAVAWAPTAALIRPVA